MIQVKRTPGRYRVVGTPGVNKSALVRRLRCRESYAAYEEHGNDDRRIFGEASSWLITVFYRTDGTGLNEPIYINADRYEEIARESSSAHGAFEHLLSRLREAEAMPPTAPATTRRFQFSSSLQKLRQRYISARIAEELGEDFVEEWYESEGDEEVEDTLQLPVLSGRFVLHLDDTLTISSEADDSPVHTFLEKIRRECLTLPIEELSRVVRKRERAS